MTTRRKWLVIAAFMAVTGLAFILRLQALPPYPVDPWWLKYGVLVVFIAMMYGPAMLAKSQTPWFLPVCLLCLCILFADFVAPSWYDLPW